MRILLAFLEKPVAKCGFTNEADTLRSTVRNQLTARLFPTRVLYDTAPEPILPSEQQLEFLTLNDLDDKEVARQLTLIDQKLFQAIRPQELLTLYVSFSGVWFFLSSRLFPLTGVGWIMTKRLRPLT